MVAILLENQRPVPQTAAIFLVFFKSIICSMPKSERELRDNLMALNEFSRTIDQIKIL